MGGQPLRGGQGHHVRRQARQAGLVDIDEVDVLAKIVDPQGAAEAGRAGRR